MPCETPERALFFGVPLDLLTMEQTLRRIETAIELRQPLVQVSLNVAKFVSMQEDLELWQDVVSSDIVNVDGAGIILGGRLIGVRPPERVAGVDLMERLLERCAERSWRPFVLGARQDVLERAVAVIRQRHPAIEFAGARNGYFNAGEESEVVEAINRSGADCLFIAMPTPRKERFLSAHRHALTVPFMMGVGGSIDVVAGHVRRAPRLMQKLGLEWLFRLAQEPRRLFGRYFSTNLAFAGILAGAAMGRQPPSARRSWAG